MARRRRTCNTSIKTHIRQKHPFNYFVLFANHGILQKVQQQLPSPPLVPRPPHVAPISPYPGPTFHVMNGAYPIGGPPYTQPQPHPGYASPPSVHGPSVPGMPAPPQYGYPMHPSPYPPPAYNPYSQ